MQGYLKSRAAAKQAGALNYCTDKPCKRGHRELRFTANGGCSSATKNPDATCPFWDIFQERIADKHEGLVEYDIICTSIYQRETNFRSCFDQPRRYPTPCDIVLFPVTLSPFEEKAGLVSRVSY
jgi:hypothetical protein